MSEFVPEPTEENAQWQEPKSEAGEPSNPETTMADIRQRIESGEEWTVELHTAFRLAGESLADRSEGNLARFELDLDCANLLASAGKREDAIGELTELADTAYEAGPEYEEFVSRVENRIEELQGQENTSS